ncbi:MAG: LysM peptidoglycan-binding domain-containing protein [Chloroflexi bacterium]|nr:LysM peptidoglycan-binding domain-containing protein [Chloroflexota bacterium]
MKRTRILLVALLVAVLLLLAVGPMTASAAGPCGPVYPCAVRYHVVCPGETLTRIAWRYGTTVGAIAAANGIWNPNRIYAGQVLRIPCPCTCWTPRPACHVVRWGETLFGIARMYGTSVWAIARANGIWDINYIRAGQCLVIP